MKAAQPNILLVEDDEDLREALRDLLEDEGFEVWTAGNGREALECLRLRGGPCVIFLDLMMPIMNGWEFYAEKARDPGLRTVPVVVCTADAQAEKKARDLGADACLPKPIEAHDLLRVANAFCHPSP